MTLELTEYPLRKGIVKVVRHDKISRTESKRTQTHGFPQHRLEIQLQGLDDTLWPDLVCRTAVRQPSKSGNPPDLDVEHAKNLFGGCYRRTLAILSKRMGASRFDELERYTITATQERARRLLEKEVSNDASEE